MNLVGKQAKGRGDEVLAAWPAPIPGAWRKQYQQVLVCK